MKSKAKTPMELGQKPIDYWKNSSFNFLENERTHTIVERGHVDQALNTGSIINETHGNKIDERVQEQAPVTVSKEKVVSGVYGPKRYVTTCYFQPKQIPVRYSETMILKIGSTNKKFFDSIYYENKLIPFKWSERMTTVIPGNEEPTLIKSNSVIPIEEQQYHYMSLEQQQVTAQQLVTA